MREMHRRLITACPPISGLWLRVDRILCSSPSSFKALSLQVASFRLCSLSVFSIKSSSCRACFQVRIALRRWRPFADDLLAGDLPARECRWYQDSDRRCSVRYQFCGQRRMTGMLWMKPLSRCVQAGNAGNPACLTPCGGRGGPYVGCVACSAGFNER